MLGILAVAILVGGFSAGRLIGQLVSEVQTPAASPTPLPSERPIPTVDVAGRDIPTLPRFPGSVRTAYGRDVSDRQRRTVAAYVAAERRTVVRGFYTDVFRQHGWEVVDLAFARGTWTFVVERAERSATLEIRDDGGHTHVSIEMIVREEPRPRETPRPRPEATPRPPTPPPDDDDDGGEDDRDDGDDDSGDDGTDDD
jgi:hypothetical protein